MTFCYLFELKSIQKYIFSSGKLKDVIASSERFATLLDEPLEQDTPPSILFHVLAQLDIHHNLIDVNTQHSSDRDFYIVRANGGSLQILSKDNALLREFRALWTLTVSQLFPGISYVDIIHGAQYTTPLKLINTGMTKMFGMGNLARPIFPRPTAAVKTFPLTAEAMVSDSIELRAYRHDGTDVATFNNAHYVTNTHLQLLNKFTPKNRDALEFANSEDAIVAGMDNQDVALVHLDGNALGLVLADLRKALADVSELHDFARKFRLFSRTIATCTQDAARHAVNTITPRDSETVAMRPILCGGDDVTVIINARDAIRFTQAFCQHFEKLTANSIKTLNRDEFNGAIKLPKLTASAGVLFQKSKQPFATAVHLAEELCKLAKNTFKRHADSPTLLPYSMLSYFRISTVYNSDLDSVREEALTLRNWPYNTEGIQLAASAFVIQCEKEEKAKIQAMSDVYMLDDVLELAKDIKAKTAHTYFTLPKIRRMLTELSLGRWVNGEDLVMQALDKQESRSQREPLLARFNNLYHQTRNDNDFWYRKGSDDLPDQSVIFDLVTLSKFMPETHKEVSDAV